MLGYNKRRSLKATAYFASITLLWLTLACILFINSNAWAKQYDQHDARLASNEEQTQDIGQAQAATIAQRRYGGKVLKISRQGNTYRVKLLLPSGVVKTVSVDASNGATL